MKDFTHFLMEKSYFCDFDGCKLKFSSEDMLGVHKKRHDMVLSLGQKGLNTADQTPTPTRFIRNCEEVGLFQDLQNVNPFEETFRKAAEAVQTGLSPCVSNPFSRSISDDTLHTPNIFPHIPEGSLTQTAQVASLPTHSPILTVVADHGLNCDSSLESISPAELNKTEHKLTKDKLKNKIRVKNLTDIMKETKVIIPNLKRKESLLSKSFPGLRNRPKKSTNTVRKIVLANNKIEEKPEIVESKSEHLERNRAAATRCREKKKKYLEHLERINQDLSKNNEDLKLVNCTLLKHVSRLKTELERHLSCNVADVETKKVLNSVFLSTIIAQNTDTIGKKKSECPIPIAVYSTTDLGLDVTASQQNMDVVQTPNLSLKHYLPKPFWGKIVAEHCYPTKTSHTNQGLNFEITTITEPSTTETTSIPVQLIESKPLKKRHRLQTSNK